MFNCQLCKRTIGPRIPQHQVVVEKRPTNTGWEIAKEIVVCPSCSESIKKEEKVANHATNPHRLRDATQSV